MWDRGTGVDPTRPLTLPLTPTFFCACGRLTAWPKSAKISQEEVDALHKEHNEFLLRFHSLLSSTNKPGEIKKLLRHKKSGEMLYALVEVVFPHVYTAIFGSDCYLCSLNISKYSNTCNQNRHGPKVLWTPLRCTGCFRILFFFPFWFSSLVCFRSKKKGLVFPFPHPFASCLPPSLHGLNGHQYVAWTDL